MFCKWCGRWLASATVENMVTPLVAGEGKTATIYIVEKEEKPTELSVFVPQVGGFYDGKSIRIIPFGAFVELDCGEEGLIHISKLANYRVKKLKVWFVSVTWFG